MHPALPALAGACLGLALLAPPAAANMAAPPPPARVSGLAAAGGPGPLEVRAADLVIDCAAGPATCRLQVTYRIHNANPASAGGGAAFYAVDTEDVTVTVDGQPAGYPVTADAADAFDATVASATGDPRALGDEPGLSRHGAALALAGGADATVVVTGVLHPRDRRRYYLSMPAAAARHRLFVHGGRADRRFRLRYLVAPIRTWSGFPAAMTFTLKQPAGWSASVVGATDLVTERAGGVVTQRGRIATDESTLEIELAVAPRPPIHAGLVLGLGGHVDDATGVRVRAGVEAGRGPYLASVAVEIERADDATGVIVVPAVTVASPWVLIIPSVGLGLGVPVRLRPTTAVGGRFLADAHFGPLGMMLTLDYYPGMAADPRRFEVALLGQLTL